jgi:hypothetical protein
LNSDSDEGSDEDVSVDESGSQGSDDEEDEEEEDFFTSKKNQREIADASEGEASE